MKPPAIRKALIVGTALFGLGIAGAGTALADTGATRPLAVAPISADWPVDDLDFLDDAIGVPVEIPSGYVLFDDDWYDDDWFDD